MSRIDNSSKENKNAEYTELDKTIWEFSRGQ